MKEGLGEIAIDFSADLRRGGPERKLVFDNRHQRPDCNISSKLPCTAGLRDSGHSGVPKL